MKYFGLRFRLLMSLVVLCCLAGAGNQVAQAQTYTNDTTLADFTGQISSYATLSNFSGGDTTSPYATTASNLALGLRVYGGGSLTNLSPNNNWILATFPTAASTIVVFPSIDHYGFSYDGYQYSIWGSNDGQTWTELFDATGASACTSNCAEGGNGEPFTLSAFFGTAPTIVNNVLTPGAGPGGTVGYIAYFTFGTAYKYYAFGASTFGTQSGNPDQELSAVGVPVVRGPTSGAMLTIRGSVNGNPVNSNIYDSQIHSGEVLTVPTIPGTWPQCNSTDANYPTDSYVLEGGSETGCNPGNAFTIPGKGTATISSGNPSVYTFNITTAYASGCDTSGHICGYPTGLLTVTNNSTSAFLGTITLSGTSPSMGGYPSPFPYCPANGIASDSWATGLTANGGSVTLALSAASNNCGGFNFDQVSAAQPMPPAAPQPVTFLFGEDKFIVTPTTINGGDVLTFRPVPIPGGQFNLPGPMIPPASNPSGLSLECVSIRDFAAHAPSGGAASPAPGPYPVCPEFQTHCLNTLAGLNTNGTCNDAESFVWTGELDAHLDPNAGYPLVDSAPEIGGVHFLGAPAVNCPQNRYSVDIITSYTGDSFNDLPLHGGSKGGLNCFVTAFDPTATAVAPGVTAYAFKGFNPPIVNNAGTFFNHIYQGSIVPLGFQAFNGAGGTPLNELFWCPSPTPGSPTGCSIWGFPIPQPWVSFSQIPTQCGPGGPPTNFSAGPIVGLLLPFGNGNFYFNWLTSPRDTGCATVQVQFSFGATVEPASFQYVPRPHKNH
jgi:hypothetical protein